MNKLIYAGLVFLLGYQWALASNDLAYITNAGNPNSIAICEINALTGQFDQCENSTLEYLATPLDIAVQTIDKITYAYIANSNYPAIVTQCVVNKKKLNNCAETDVASYAGITFNRSDNLYAYLTYGESIKKCQVSPQGQLNERYCNDSGAGNIFLNGAIYLYFKTFNDNTYAYIANGDYHINASVIQCSVEENGDLTYCIDSGAGPHLNGAADVDFVTIANHTHAYITQSGGAVMQCSVQHENGLFYDCISLDTDFNTPIGMSIREIGNQPYAYIVDGGFTNPNANQVWQCAIGLTGRLDCQDSGVDALFNNPFGIAML